MSLLDDCRVALVRDRPKYSRARPYHPSEHYPEWTTVPLGEDDNPGFRAVRNVLRAIGLDEERFDTAEWNPLSQIIRPGETVVLKPNMVSHRNLGERNYGLTDTDSLVTHGSTIRAVAEYVAKALEGRGRIIIGDSPIQDTNWDALLELLGIPELRRYFAHAYPAISLEARDWRIGKAIINRYGIMLERVHGSSEGYVEVDLGTRSLLVPLMARDYAFGVARYPKHRMRRAHTPDRNLYLFPEELLGGDVVINLPKLKTHMKAAVSVAMKNFVGINGHKDYLPHFRFGSPKDGGDEYPDGNCFWDLMWAARHREWELERGRLKIFWLGVGYVAKQLLPILAAKPRDAASLGGGGWYGNDTLWRTVLDITAAFFYYDRNARVVRDHPAASVRYLTIVDGLVGGHRESPLAPSPVASGVMLGGFNPLAVDTVAATVMGFDIDKVAQIRNAYGALPLRLSDFGPDDIRIAGLEGTRSLKDIKRSGAFVPFEPSLGFRGRLESERTLPLAGVSQVADIDRE